MDVKETDSEDEDWINLAEDLDRSGAGSYEHGDEPSGSTKGGEFLV
jgi:hypothetical protein